MVGREGIVLNPVTSQVNGHLTCEVFPRGKWWVVVCALARPTGTIFAEHGYYPTKASAIQGLKEVFALMRRNPSLIEKQGLTRKEYEKILLKSALDKFAKASLKPLRRPTKAELKRWRSFDPFSGVTEKDRQEAWKRGCVI